MYQVLALRKAGKFEPPKFELWLKDLENDSRGYMGTTRYGTEVEIRELLKAGGATDVYVDGWFAKAKS